MWIFFYGGMETFLEEVMGQLMETLEVGSTEIKKFQYIKVSLKQEKEVIIMEQRGYVEGIKKLRRDYYKMDTKRSKRRNYIRQ